MNKEVEELARELCHEWSGVDTGDAKFETKLFHHLATWLLQNFERKNPKEVVVVGKWGGFDKFIEAGGREPGILGCSVIGYKLLKGKDILFELGKQVELRIREVKK